MTTRALVSADNHVFEPPDLWQTRLPVDQRERGPRIVIEDGWVVLAIDGVPPRKLSRTAGLGESDAGAKRIGGSADAAARRKDMEIDGVVAEVIYPTWGLFIDMIPDAQLALACAQVYNDWCAETFLDDPDVFVPAAVIPLHDLATATAELERVVGLGYRSAMIPTSPPDGTRYNQDVFDPIWQIASDAGLPLSLHTGTGALPQRERGPGGAVINYAGVGLLSAETLCYFAASGVLEKFPGLRLVFVETGAGWLAYCCERMDEAFEEHEQWVKPKLDATPSEYVRRQCHVTLGADRAPILTRDITGIEPLMWASDYPHPEGTFPESQAVVDRIFDSVPEDEVAAIVGGNAARLYGISLDTVGA